MAWFNKKNVDQEEKTIERKIVRVSGQVHSSNLSDVKDALRERNLYFNERFDRMSLYDFYCYEDEIEEVETVIYNVVNGIYEDEFDDYEDDFFDSEPSEFGFETNLNPEDEHDFSEDDIAKFIETVTPAKQKIEEKKEESVPKNLKIENVIHIKKDIKTRKKLNRNTELKARFTDEEVKFIEEKIKKSGLKKGEYIRKCLLEKEIIERADNDFLLKNINALLDLKSELGMVGGLLKAAIKPNENNHQITKEEMDQIKSYLNYIEDLKKKIEKEVKKKWQS